MWQAERGDALISTAWTTVRKGVVMNILKELLNKLGIKSEKDRDREVKSSEVLEMIIKSDMENLKETGENLDAQAFEMAVDMILKARTIYVLGIRGCEPLAGYLGFYLNMMFDNVKVLQTNSPSEIFEQMMRIGGEDVFIGISFPRYSMRTLKAMEFANNRSAFVISVTDSDLSPMKLYSSCNLIARSALTSVMDSLTAPVSVLGALVAALSLRRDREMTEYLDELENVWGEYQIYGVDEMNQPEDHIEIYQGQKEKVEEE